MAFIIVKPEEHISPGALEALIGDLLPRSGLNTIEYEAITHLKKYRELLIRARAQDIANNAEHFPRTPRGNR